jgi:hypothetical protein
MMAGAAKALMAGKARARPIIPKNLPRFPNRRADSTTKGQAELLVNLDIEGLIWFPGVLLRAKTSTQTFGLWLQNYHNYVTTASVKSQ